MGAPSIAGPPARLGARILSALLVGFACLGALFASRASADQTWSPPTTLSTAGFEAFEPSVGIDATGNAVATWFGAEATTGDLVQASGRPAGGAWASPATLSGAGGFHPDLAVSASGAAVAVWELDSLTEGSYIESAVRQGGVWSTPTALPKGAELHGAYFPRVSVNSAGDALAAWEQCYTADNTDCFEGQGRYLVRVSKRPAGGSWSAPETLSSESENAIKIEPAVDRSGDLAVVWEDTIAGTIHGAIKRSDAGWSTPVISEPSVPSGSPALAFDGAGNLTAVWDALSHGNYRAETSQAAAGSTGWSSPASLSQPGPDAFRPRLAVAEGGDAVVAWETVAGDIVQAAVRVNGVWQPAQTISIAGAGSAQPRVGIDAQSEAVVIWESATGISASIKSPGSQWSPTALISPPGVGAREPELAVNANGSGAAIWRTDGSSKLVQAASLDPISAPPVTNSSPPASGGPGGSPASGTTAGTTLDAHSLAGVARVKGTVRIKRGKALLQISCTGNAGCAGLAKLIKGRLLGKAPFSLRKGATKTVRVALTGRALRLLARASGNRLAVRLAGTGLHPQRVMLLG